MLLTGHENEAVAEEAVRRGAQDYLSKKSLNGEALARAIMYAIERKGIEANLRASEERYRTLMDALDEAIVVVDRELRIIMSNSAFKKAAAEGGVSAAATGRKLQDGFSPLPAKSLEFCGKAFSEGKEIVSEETCLWNSRQSVLELKCVPVRPTERYSAWSWSPGTSPSASRWNSSRTISPPGLPRTAPPLTS